MPPSPSTRRCPKENFHKRGQSFGTTLPVKPKDDELLLFTDMQKNERVNFLLEPAEDFDESISKFSCFRDIKIGGHVATQGENYDFLNVDGDRNDYDWLLTPPQTPLFRSLDDEEHHHIGLARRGRAPIKPISISRSSTMENSRRSDRSSASPNRLSPSPRSCSSSAALTRTKSSNASSRCSAPLALQPSTSSRRSSTPPASKTLTPPRRSLSPASRRMSTGSSDPMLNRKRGTSPVKSSERSTSPRLQGWQSSDRGFSFEAPPNLRTSLSDRPISRSRGGSPSSFSGLDLGWRGRTQSMSPTPSRRASSLCSNDRDRFSSYSKASATSSAEDDLDSMQSVPVSYSSSPASRKNLVMKTRTIVSSKKPTKSFSPISAPKRPFDSAVWLSDHRKTPQDMFRPLLSSVPSHTFGAGKGNDAHQPTISHKSSLNIGSNTSSEHGATLGPCADTKKEQQDAISECEARTSSIRPDCIQCSLSSTRSGLESPATVKSVESTKQDLDMGRSIETQASCNVTSSSEVEHGKMATCARCGKLCNGIVDGEVDYCIECALVDENCSVDYKIQNLEEEHQQDVNFATPKPCITSEAPQLIPECSGSINDSSLDSQLVNDESQGDCLQRCPASQSSMDITEEMLSGHHVENVFAENIRPSHDSHQCSVSDGQQIELTSGTEGEILRDQPSDHHNGIPQCLPESVCDMDFVSDTCYTDSCHKMGSIGHPNLKTENTFGVPLLLLQKSSSNKWPIVEGRTYTPIKIPFSEPYYATDNVSMSKITTGRDSSSASSSIDQGSSRKSDVQYYTKDSVSILKCNIGRGSSSAASSLDQGSSRQSDAQWEHPKSSNCYDFQKAPISSTISCQSIASMSDISTSNRSVSFCPQGNAIVDTGFLTDNSENSPSRVIICTEELDGSCKYNLSSAIECWSAAQAIVNGDSESVEDEAIENENRYTCGMAQKDNLSAHLCLPDTEMHSIIPVSLAPEGSYIQNAEEGTSAATQCYPIDTRELANDECGSNNKLDDSSVSIISVDDMLVSATEAITMELPGKDESSVTVEGSREKPQQCFTLEEATDTILFCSSIVHDTAYRAAIIGLEREQKTELASAPCSTVTMVEKSIPKRDTSLKLPHRRIPKHRKKSEGGSITETSKMEVVAKDPVPVHLVPDLSRTADSLKPPKLESKCNCAIM